MISIIDAVTHLKRHQLLAAPFEAGDLTVTGIADDSRQVRPGDLFCAIPGTVRDGHDFLRAAAEAGAAAAVVERPAADVRLPQIQVTSSRRAASLMARLAFDDPSAQLTLIGVTGTNGKTTTTQLIRHILGHRFAAGSMGTLGVIDPSGRRETTRLTTPGPVEFVRRLADLRARGADCVVAEVSSHALAQDRVAGARFAIAVFTNLTRDHLDYHSDLDDYRAAKLRLAELAERALVINADDPAWSGLAGSQKRTLRYGLHAEAEYVARDLEHAPDGSTWTLEGPDGAAAVSLPLVGDFNVSNALAAAAAAGAMDFRIEEIARALSSAPQIAGRLERLVDRPLILRDYAHTPDALARALEALRPLTRGRLIAVFGCGGDRDPGKRPLMGRAAAERADYLIVTSDNPRTERPEAIVEDILPGVAGAAYEAIVDRRAAIARSLEIARPEDVVLLAGKGHETYQEIGAERVPFDEAVIVAELRERGGPGPGPS